MNKMIGTLKSQALAIGIALLSSCSLELASFTNTSFYLTRPQGIDAARELVGWQTLINRDADCFYGAFSIAPTYIRSFHPEQTAALLFGNVPLTFSGSRSFNRGPNDLLADYFGLPADYKSVVCFEPRIRNFILDFNAYIGLENIAHGLYIRAHVPMTNTTWDLTMRESVKDPGTAFHPAGYMSTARINRADLAPDVTSYFFGKTTFGDMKEPLKFGMIQENLVQNRIADLCVVLGWNATGAKYHAGINARFGFPTGNRPTAQFLFEPIAGNGKHWELGVGFTGHYDVWASADNYSAFVVYLDANFTHLMPVTYKRSYDFINAGPGSRYMLLEEIAPQSTNLFVNAAGVGASSTQYRQRLLPAINVTTLDSKISIGIQADIALKFSYQRGGLGVDGGYNFWGRSREKIHCRQKFDSDRYALKGDAQIYGFDSVIDTTIVPLSATQNHATLQAGQNGGNGFPFLTAASFTNQNADSPTAAFDSANSLSQLNTADAASLSIARSQVFTSNPAQLLTDADINSCCALLPRAFTNGFFVHLGHTWNHDDQTCFDPFLGLGAQVDWASSRGCPSNNSGNGQWGVWAKGGFGF